MASRKFHFFTDANPQASSGSAYLNVQTADGAYGPVTSNTAGHDEYRVTSLHKATGFDPTAYAVCDGMICVQQVDATHVNIILKPLVQPPLNFAPVKYIIYKGILASSLIAGNDVAPATSNRLAQVIQETQTKKNTSAGGTPKTAPKEALGIGLTGTGFADTDPIDNLFFRSAVSFQPPTVRGGWSLGRFDRTGFGIEVLLEGLNFRHSLKLTRQMENRISVATLTVGANDAEVFEHWHAKEQVLGFMDPCAFYGSFFSGGVMVRTSTTTAFAEKSGAALYHDVLFPFANRNKAYLDLRNEHNFSFNYFRNYGASIRISTKSAPVDYYASGWPILALTAADLATGNITSARNPFRLRLPVGDNQKPLIFVSQGYRDINRKGVGFPAELKNAERFFDAFGNPSGGYTVSKQTNGPSALTLVVPNVSGLGGTTPVSCYIRLKYLKRQHAAAATATTVQSGNYLDNLIWPLDLRLLPAGAMTIASSFYDEEVYIDANSEPNLLFDGIANVGIAQDGDNVCLLLLPTAIRTQSGPAAELVALSGETSEFSGHYPNLVASKYPGERVRRGDLAIAQATTMPVADFVQDGLPDRFAAPDFGKLIVLTLSRATYSDWIARIAGGNSGIDNRFRTYLGVETIQTQSDLAGVPYSKIELVLRGLALDASGNAYEVKEIDSVPGPGGGNVWVYANAGA